jgi:RNA polymerase sigma-70 factor (ECF subfamily)
VKGVSKISVWEGLLVARESESLMDEILVLDCQMGSLGALEALVSRWQKRLWRHAYCLTGNAEAAWDVTQESWLGIIRGIARLDDPARFPDWAFRIVTHKASDWLRERMKTRQPLDGELEDQQVGDGPQRRETTIDLFSVLMKLPPEQRSVLCLYYIEGFGIGEVATTLGIPQGTVKSRLHTARAAFKQLWQPAGELN